MELALLTIIAAVIGGGVAGALANTWSLHLRVRRLEKQVLSERNTTAAQMRWNKDEELAKMLMKENKNKSERYANDWD